MSRGYFGVVCWNTKNGCNVGGVLRSAEAFGAAFCGFVGRRYAQHAADVTKASRHMPVFHWLTADEMFAGLPKGAAPIAVEIAANGHNLAHEIHLERAVYILGPEDGSLPAAVVNRCARVVEIPASPCLNLATAASIVMYDRIAKELRP